MSKRNISKKKITKRNIDDLILNFYEYSLIEMSNSSYDILNNPNDPDVSRKDFLNMFLDGYTKWCEEVIKVEYDKDASLSVCQLIHDIDSCTSDAIHDPEATKFDCFVGIIDGIERWKRGELI